MLGTITRRLRRLVREPRTDGGVATAQTPDTTPSLGIPPDERRCPNGCDARTELVATANLLDSEDEAEWLAGNDLDRRGIDTAGRCPECGEVHTNTAPRT